RRLVLVAVAPVRERDLADVDVTARVDGESVRGHELPRLEPGRALPQAREHLALRRVDADAWPDIPHVVVDAHTAADLADVEARLGAPRQVESRGTVHVDPLRLELPVAVEHLHAVILTVGDVHPAVGVAADVVRDVELPGIRARLPP